MDTYSLINSKAIQDHCRKINHQFNTEELAVLIYRNNRMNINEKIKLYQELIKDYPDMEVIQRINCEHYDSVKDMIQGEINRLQNLKQEMITPSENMIYTSEIFYKTSHEFEESDNFYKTYDEVCKALNEKMQDYEDYPMLAYRIIKRSFIRDERKIIENYIVSEDKSITLINIDDTTEFLDIDNICLNIPTPFEKGDILTFPRTSLDLLTKENVFVLDWLCNWREDFQKILDKGNHDSSDMNGTGYSMYEGEIWWDHRFAYDSFEYFEGELKGKQKMLKAISSYMKNKIGPDLVIEAYRYLTARETLKSVFWQGFTEEGLKLAGLSDEDIDKMYEEKDRE